MLAKLPTSSSYYDLHSVFCFCSSAYVLPASGKRSSHLSLMLSPRKIASGLAHNPSLANQSSPTLASGGICPGVDQLKLRSSLVFELWEKGKMWSGRRCQAPCWCEGLRAEPMQRKSYRDGSPIRLAILWTPKEAKACSFCPGNYIFIYLKISFSQPK